MKEWLNFRSSEITHKSALSGAWGGHASIQWTSKGNPFTVESIKKFATDHNETYISTIPVSTEDMSKWHTSSGDKIFPLSYDGLKTIPTDDELWKNFPRHINDQNATMVQLDNGWITALGGFEKPAYSYALISSDGNQMALYHLWGE